MPDSSLGTLPTQRTMGKFVTPSTAARHTNSTVTERR